MSRSGSCTRPSASPSRPGSAATSSRARRARTCSASASSPPTGARAVRRWPSGCGRGGMSRRRWLETSPDTASRSSPHSGEGKCRDEPGSRRSATEGRRAPTAVTAWRQRSPPSARFARCARSPAPSPRRRGEERTAHPVKAAAPPPPPAPRPGRRRGRRRVRRGASAASRSVSSSAQASTSRASKPAAATSRARVRPAAAMRSIIARWFSARIRVADGRPTAARSQTLEPPAPMAMSAVGHQRGHLGAVDPQVQAPVAPAIGGLQPREAGRIQPEHRRRAAPPPASAAAPRPRARSTPPRSVRPRETRARRVGPCLARRLSARCRRRRSRAAPGRRIGPTRALAVSGIRS